MGERAADLAMKLEAKGAETLVFFHALPPEAWTRPVYTEGMAWDARQVLCHFVSAERSFLRLVTDIASGGPGASPDFNVDRFNASQVSSMANDSAAELLSAFEAARRDLAAYVRGLDDAALDNVGRHPALGDQSLEKSIKVIYLHNAGHIRDIRAALGL
ncbi:MAG: DinB family protein [Anaerolineae bacterium]|nr:DinB family protein [Anaerolineae bacterium]